MLGGFQDILIENGWRRFTRTFEGNNWVEKDNYTSNFVSTYGPTEYFFSHPDNTNILCYGLDEQGKPPVMKFNGLQIGWRSPNAMCREDAYRILQYHDKPADIYEAFIIGKGVMIVFIDGKPHVEIH